MNKFGYRSEATKIIIGTEAKRLLAIYSHDEQKQQTLKRFMIRHVWLPNLQEKDGRGNHREFF